ncbi:YkvA family protein [Roseomonas sp. CCTCC AB2023176]|uniref:YkvA family protein n=1 Tax=Roseomonas sp. CCTCC AB2023176 TaxID=3342640 RepID=UPI0035DB0C4A
MSRRVGDRQPRGETGGAMGWVARLKGWAKAIRRDSVALWLAARDPRTPWFARAFAIVVAAYALSPVDLIPDVIPVLGLLDEAILLPLAILLLVRMLPPAVFAEHRAKAITLAERPVSRLGLAIVVAIWLALALLAVRWLGPG